MQVKNTEYYERSIKIKVMDKKHSSEIAVKIARCSTFQLHKHTQHILLIHKKLQLYTTEIINNIYKMLKCFAKKL